MTPGHFVGSVHELCFSGVQIFRETTNQAVHESGAPWTGSRAIGVPMRVEGAALFRGQAGRHRHAGDAGRRRRARLLHAVRLRHPGARRRRMRAGGACAADRASRHRRRVRRQGRAQSGARAPRRIAPAAAVGAAVAGRESLRAAVSANAAPARAGAAGRAHRRRRRRRGQLVAESAVSEPSAHRRRGEGVHAQPHRSSPSPSRTCAWSSASAGARCNTASSRCSASTRCASSARCA